ncbi:ABC transporter ATP-binding protein [Phytohabitans rumicis]|uniref:Multidrug ABC transporter ATP-binding protein n=1 Tax=Phytohabitans rumicis TaxID=1076125 RepID=A0A6V8KZC4_9ACTN|nr:ABC transporter ATP-binding protein [Phytohabitans rumicis]GFJ87146.1 multidrug ABC transporter ATP-binding protein [Phytohabitans rumicis]
MSAALEVRDLVKRYPKGRVNAVDGLTFEVAAGEIFGLLGPNGAGKSTTIGVLTTRVRATSGYAAVCGVDVHRDPVGARRLLAMVPQRTNLDRSLSPRRNLLFHAAYHDVPARVRRARAAELLEAFGLAERADERIEVLSGGMTQRIMIARALMHQPQVLFLDEPTAGLDPQSRLFLWDRVRELRERGVTIVLTTHDMDEAADLAHRVGIVDHGKLLALDTPAALIRGLADRTVLDLSVVPAPRDDPASVLTALTTVDGVKRGEWVAPCPTPPGATSANGQRRLRLHLDSEPTAALALLVAVLDRRQARLSDVHVGRASLEDVFIAFTGRGLR